jgi:twitching motility protein PilT
MAETLGSLLAETAAPDIDPLALKLVPPGMGAIGFGFSGGYLNVAWPKAPAPGDVAKVSAAAGVPVKPVTLTPAGFEALLHKAQSVVIPESMDATNVLDLALSLAASDVHLSAGLPPALRVGGDLRSIGQVPMSAQEVFKVAAWLVGEEALAPDRFTGDLDRASEYRGWRLRVNVYRQCGQLAIAVRIIPGSPPEFSSLRLPEVVAKFAELPRGLVLFAGPTGSGKSTSQAALLDIVNKTSSRHIVTVEDPIEYVHPQRNCVVHQREVGSDTASFAVALKSVLRQDPDVILVGEMRDLETISTTITAAETGHLVFATVHAGSAPEAVDRIIDSFPPESKALVRAQLAACLSGIVCQTLLPAADRPGERQVVAEVLVMHDAARAHIRAGDTHQLRNDYRLAELGSMSLDQALAEAVALGWVDRDVALGVCRDPEAFAQFLRVRMESPVRILEKSAD